MDFTVKDLRALPQNEVLSSVLPLPFWNQGKGSGLNAVFDGLKCD